MRIKEILAAVFMLPLLYACQSESEQVSENYQETVLPQRVTTIKASISNSNQTRAQVKYGTEKAEDGEIFMWNEGDQIFLYNLSNFEDNPKDAAYYIKDLKDPNRKNAEFIFDDRTQGDGHATKPLIVKNGDVILACNNSLERYAIGNNNGNIIYDERNIFKLLNAGTEDNNPQYIVGKPNDESLSYMKDNFKMYDVVKADDNGQIPDLHFKHLSALIRVTLHNETGEDLYPTKIEFKYPGTNSFFNVTMCFSVNDDMSLCVYDNEEDKKLYSYDEVYTDNIGITINGKNDTDDAGDPIPQKESYELYISTVPRIMNDSKGENLTISVIKKHDTDHPYSITIPNFNTVIEAGKRYWFDLTAVGTEKGERKLVLTSEWKKLQNGQGTTTPEGEQ